MVNVEFCVGLETALNICEVLGICSRTHTMLCAGVEQKRFSFDVLDVISSSRK